jgi:UDP-N-acetylmuramoyl-L-alanyl-D-glutamate--2,6-diaminopimelate ligase
MKFLELLERVKGRGVVVREVFAGGDPEVMGVCEDSRKVKAGDVFVARGGTKVDGAKFVAEAVARGAVGVVGENGKLKIENSKNVAWAVVEDVNLACAVLAHEVAGNPTAGMKMIGVTGTKGKTTVAYLLRSVLKAAGHKVGMIGTVEIDDGEKVVPAEMTTPGSVELVELFCRMRANGVTHCVMEVSSHALHQRRVAGIDWAVAIFTNLTGDHLDYHGTLEEYAAAKAMLFEGLREGAVAVVNGDDKWAGRMVEGCGGRVIEYRHGGNAARDRVLFGIHKMSSKGMLMWVWPMVMPAGNPQHSIKTPLVGRHNAYNIASVYAAAEGLGIEISAMDNGLENCSGAPGRLQRVGDDSGEFQVFVDYAHTHDALENVLTALRSTMGVGSRGPSAGGMLSGHAGRGSGSEGSVRAAEHGTPPRLICVFGCGGDRDRTKRPKMGAIAERLADVVVVTSDNPRTEDAGRIIEEICAGFSAGWKTGGKITIEPDRRAAIRLAIGMARAGDVVLLAGKGHENYQIIGTTKHHFDDVEEAEAALRLKLATNEHE